MFCGSRIVSSFVTYLVFTKHPAKRLPTKKNVIGFTIKFIALITDQKE